MKGTAEFVWLSSLIRLSIDLFLCGQLVQASFPTRVNLFIQQLIINLIYIVTVTQRTSETKCVVCNWL